ncbi:TetR/AcrR family transcriptional regulator [Tepidibacter hydrothermalis]|uniref:TetR/AcrR family transcriptional regulator n=1 Tax=Tepidibacter hydrothermalis TaxID=3036126 RepID=A0ABY8EHF7_9FIRM|nr:TetR/AcrR family transcriptional regulator [Tepidibacter hydrothermalis]WFD11290.1 TetR/AcrR family transcriptional regulator [Tepidibacter hydrothermalis]
MKDIKEPIQKRAIEKKLKLIESAKKVFNDKGYHNTHIKDITLEAGISTGLFYKYFKDKNDIYIQVVKLLIEKDMEVVLDFKDRMSKEDNKKQVIRSYIENRMELIIYKGIMEELDVLIKENQSIKNFINNVKKGYLNAIKDILFQIWDNTTESTIHVGAMLIWRTIYSNIIEIANMNNLELKNEYIDNLTDLIYQYMKLD